MIHMLALSVPSLPAQLPADCGAITKTLGFRSHIPSSWAMKEAKKVAWSDHMHLTVHLCCG